MEALQLPDDLAAALDAQPPARQTYEGFTRGVKKQLLWWVASAKKPETRAKRLAQLIADSAAGQRIAQMRR